MSKLTNAFVSRSRSRSTSPTDTCSSAAAEAGNAVGMACFSLLPGFAGHRPAISVAWLVISLMEAACSSAVLPLPALAGTAGSAPGTSSSGSDQNASWKVNGMPGIAEAIRDRSAALPWTASPVLFTNAVTDRAVSGVVARSCWTASGRA